MTGLSLGLSVSDYSEQRGHTIAEVYRSVGHIEFGGLNRVFDDAEVTFALEQNPALRIGRHLVSAQLPGTLSIEDEAAAIRSDLAAVVPQYMVTDAMFWNFGGNSERNMWPRPCSLSREVARRIARNSTAIGSAVGVPLYVENPPTIAIDGGLTVAEFLHALASQDAHLCFDVGHFWASCENDGLSVEREFRQLPFEAFRMAHIAGLSRVEYRGTTIHLDNHDVVPSGECIDLLRAFLARAPAVRHLTFEAELASAEVQLSGVQLLVEALDDQHPG